MNVDVDPARSGFTERDKMKTYVMDTDDNISVFANAKDASGEQGRRFTDLNGLISITTGWPMTSLVDVWNSLPGVVPVKRFMGRKYAEKRIWARIQLLGPAVAPEPAPETPAVAPRKTKAAKKASPKPEANVARDGSKKAIVLAMMKRPDGATLSEITQETGWQPHTVRGFISATIGKRLGLEVKSTKREDGERVYQIAS